MDNEILSYTDDVLLEQKKERLIFIIRVLEEQLKAALDEVKKQKERIDFIISAMDEDSDEYLE